MRAIVREPALMSAKHIESQPFTAARQASLTPHTHAPHAFEKLAGKPALHSITGSTPTRTETLSGQLPWATL